MKRRYWLALASILFHAGCGPDAAPPEKINLTRADLLKPETCKECHARHYEEWSGSMHAYAADDPVFLAMNRRGQRERKLGSFCVNCHAPMAVRENATTDGLNLADVPRELKGVTCYFCHNIDKITGDHNNLVTLANDLKMRGSIRDPIRNGAHFSGYSEFTDRDSLKSSDACGACHDLRLTQPEFAHEVHLERTYEEWTKTIFNKDGDAGRRCGSCHMRTDSARQGPVADVPGLKLKSRPRHFHDFPGVDLALDPFPEAAPQNDYQKEKVGELLDTSLVLEICAGGGTIQVLLDNVSSGHNWPTGATQDRRAWVELFAYQGQDLVFKTLSVPEGTSVVGHAAANPQVQAWFMRDLALKENGEEAHMFWDVARIVPAAESDSPTISGTLASNKFTSAHLQRRFPGEFGVLDRIPDRIVMNLYIRPIDYDLVDDLIASKDLAPDVREKIPTLAVLPNRGTRAANANITLEWTKAIADSDAGFTKEIEPRIQARCISPGRRAQ